jgi:predicted double-glycine peptidase
MIPRIIQYEDWSCGTASLCASYASLGVNIPETAIISEMRLTTEGASWEQMAENALLHNFEVEVKKEAKIGDLAAEDGEAVIVCFQSRDEAGLGSHFSLVAALTKETITLSDVAWGNYEKYSLQDFDKLWRDDEGKRNLMKINVPRGESRTPIS